MGILEVLGFVCLSLVIRLIFWNRMKLWGLLIISIMALYTFQPITPIRYFDFFLPTILVLMIILIWGSTGKAEKLQEKTNTFTLVTILATILLISATRYLSPFGILTEGRPPPIVYTLLIIAGGGLFWVVLKHRKSVRPYSFSFSILIVLVLFVLIKYPPFLDSIVGFLKEHQKLKSSVTPGLDIRWFGFSYISFRLIHTIRDHQNNRLPDVNLLEFVVFVIFFPVLSAGPIDRIQRFIVDLRNPTKITPDDLGNGFRRVMIGMLKKFVVADSISLVALNNMNVEQVKSSLWAWLILYAYAFLIYFDFSGYTDIAVGIGNILGFRLPENFNKPYLKPNLTQFWNSWHISLTQWFRSYFFNPITRKITKSSKTIPTDLKLLIVQVSTMVLIGLWHGISLNFAIWGFWHGLGLFTHNKWSSKFGSSWSELLINHPGITKLLSVTSGLITFNFVSLGWIWFAIDDPIKAIGFGLKLFGY